MVYANRDYSFETGHNQPTLFIAKHSTTKGLITGRRTELLW